MTPVPSPMQRVLASRGGERGAHTRGRLGGALGGEREDAEAGVNVVPMIDVVLCLIVFFLLVGHLAAERRVPMNLPRAALASADDAPSSTGDVVVINIERAPGQPTDAPTIRMTIDGRAFNDAVLLAAAAFDLARPPPVRSGAASGASAAKASDKPVEIRADRTLAFDAVGAVLRELELAGVTRVRLAVLGDDSLGSEGVR